MKKILLPLALAGASTVNAAPATLKNELGMSFVAIPGGDYLMGSAAAEADRREKPQHREHIAPFYLATHEVSQGDWQRVLGENPYQRDRSNPYYRLPAMAARITKAEHPATIHRRP